MVTASNSKINNGSLRLVILNCLPLQASVTILSSFFALTFWQMFCAGEFVTLLFQCLAGTDAVGGFPLTRCTFLDDGQGGAPKSPEGRCRHSARHPEFFLLGTLTTNSRAGATATGLPS